MTFTTLFGGLALAGGAVILGGPALLDWIERLFGRIDPEVKWVGLGVLAFTLLGAGLDAVAWWSERRGGRS